MSIDCSLTPPTPISTSPWLLTGKRPTDWSALVAHARGWAIKAFFLPLMFVFANEFLAKVWAHASPTAGFEQLFSFGIDLLYLIDVLLAVAAYTLTLRLVDSHIRSAEPTVAGWVVCLLCYPPFWEVIGAKYLAYDQDDVYWGHFIGGYPILYVLWGSAILALVAIYVWATMAFGLRFSNLTNRGIITSGPYRWVKHPAYLCKNLSYWLISVPFLTSSDWSVAVKSCLLLAGREPSLLAARGHRGAAPRRRPGLPRIPGLHRARWPMGAAAPNGGGIDAS